MQVIEAIKNLLIETLNLGERGASLVPESSLLGSIPELDSMAVVQLIAGLEQHFGFSVNDDEISAENFQTLGSLAAFVHSKLANE